jgi:DnaJ family protein B protein 4
MYIGSLTYTRTVVFVVEEKKHGRFERVDDDLVTRMNLTLSQALLGPEGGGSITKEVEQLDGRRIQVTLPEGVSVFSIVIVC